MKIIKFMEDCIDKPTKLFTSDITNIVVAICFICFICLTFYVCTIMYEDVYNSPSRLIANDPDITKLNLRITNSNYINNKISNYYYRTNTYPKDISELSTFISNTPLNDPLTNKSDWEVCDIKTPNVWYRTIIEPYNSNLSLWNSTEHAGIYKVRPRQTTEEIEIKKRWNSYLKRGLIKREVGTENQSEQNL